MKIKKTVVVLAMATGAFALGANAETARWIIKPTYQSVTPLSDDLYKVKHGYAQLVIDRDGNAIVSDADSITPFTEGIALVLKRVDERLKLEGLLREDKSVVSIVEEVYVDEYPFFSEGLLPVSNKDGNYGYMDVNGKMKIKFKYSKPHPFSEGLAAVSKVSKGKKLLSKIGAEDILGNDKVFYINAYNQELKLQKIIGDVYFGSTFKNGEALVINKDRQYCIINKAGQLVRIEPALTLRFDKKNALTDIEENEETAVVRQKNGPDVFSNGKKLGYRQGSKIILPAQFSSADPFDKKRAIATRLGGTGVLELISGNIVVNMKRGSLAPTSSDVESFDLEVIMPEDYVGTDIEVEVVNKKGDIISSLSDADDGNGRHTVSLMLPKDNSLVRVIADNLEVWNSEITPRVGSSVQESEGGVKFSFSSTSAKANSKDAAAISITIYNNTSQPLSGRLNMSGASPSVRSVDIPAGGKKTISAYFSRVVKSETRTVMLSVNGYSTSRKISLQPFFNF